MEFIERKIGKLNTYYDKIIDSEVFLSLDSKGSPIKDKVVKVKINVPQSQFVAHATAKTFEEAVDEVADNLKRQLTRHKDRQHP